jgi:micrococcal nuclease
MLPLKPRKNLNEHEALLSRAIAGAHRRSISVKICRAVGLIVVLLLCPEDCLGWQGKVVHLEDGDSGIALLKGRRVKFRLYGIDAPELHQDFGRRAKSFSSKLILRKVVELEPLDHDGYGREVVLAFVDGKCVNQELVRAGLAWVYLQYCTISRCNEWLRLQQEAKEKRLGLWTMRRPVPPWEYREHHRPDRSSLAWNLLTRLLGDYCGNASSQVFHRKGCKYHDSEGSSVRFASREEAVLKGYRPCRLCKP